MRRVRREYDLLLYLHGKGMPIAVPFLTDAGEPCARTGGGIYTLYPALPGRSLEAGLAGESPAIARQLGRMLAGLHLAMADYPKSDAFPRLDLEGSVHPRCCTALLPRRTVVSRADLARCCDVVVGTLKKLGSGSCESLIHCDAKPANFLCAGRRITGIVDFDVVARGARMFDPCYCAVNTFRRAPATVGTALSCLGFLDEMLAGYQTVSRLAEVERRSAVAMLMGVMFNTIAFDMSLGNPVAARWHVEMLLCTRDACRMSTYRQFAVTNDWR